MSDFSLSVIMPNYNHGHYLAEVLESMLAQLPYFDEIIVVDDASTDNSVEILEKYAEKYPLITLVRNEKNLGAVPALQKGLERARGSYVFLPSADDKILPGFFKKSTDLLKQYPEAGLCCCDSFTLSEATGLRTVNRRGLSETPCYIPPDRLAGIMREKIVFLSGFGSILKKSELLKTGLFPELKWSSDRIYVSMIALRAGLCCVPEPLVVWFSTAKSYAAQGVGRRGEHEKILESVFELLKQPQYSDVLEKFKKSCVLASLHLAGLRVMAANARFRDYLSPNLVRLVLWDEFKNSVSGYAPEAVKKIYRGLCGRPGA